MRALLWAVASWLLVGLPAGAADGKRPPNILLILADDMGYECLGAYGSTSYKTPNLDKLAREGMRFDYCYAQPLCTPSRVELMTGLYNQRNYIRFGLLDPKAVTFAQILKKAGYTTGIFGKWQLANGFDGPKHFGFDEHLVWNNTVRKSRYPNPVFERNGKIIEHTRGEYGPDIVNDYLCDFIERNREKPFLAYYPMLLVHAPFVPTPESADWDPKARNEQKGADKKHFAGMVHYCDKMVGKVLAKLDALGLRENTLVLFTGDNGTGRGVVSHLGDKTVIGGKGLTTDAGMHTPFLARWPGKIPAGKSSRDLVAFCDFLPTLLDVTGAKLPEGLKLDGQSFLPQLLGQPGKPREWLYTWYARDGGPTGVEFAWNQRFKLYADGRFYDVAANPLEKKPLNEEKLDGDAKKVKAVLQSALNQYKGTRSASAGSKSGS